MQQDAKQSTINTMELHDRLEQLLKNDDLEHAKNDPHRPVSTRERIAVVRGKSEVKRCDKLADVFTHDISEKREEGFIAKTGQQPALDPILLQTKLHELAKLHQKNKQSDQIISEASKRLKNEKAPKRGFAEKMFADVGIGQSEIGVKRKSQDHSKNSRILPTISASSNEQDDLLSPIGKELNLPFHPSAALPTSSSRLISNRQVDSSQRLYLVNTNVEAHPHQYNWGSLGPPTEPTELAESLRTADREAEHSRCKTKEGLEPQLGRSTELAASLNSLESQVNEINENEKQNERAGRSLTGSQIDIINRIHAWRVRTGPTPSKTLYAPSASATEPSAFYRGLQSKEDEGSTSHLTSISRRFNVEAEKEKGIRRGKEGDSSNSTIVYVRVKEDQKTGIDDDAIDPNEAKPASIKRDQTMTPLQNTAKLVDIVSPPMTTGRSEGTGYIRRLGEEECDMLFNLHE